MGTNVFVNDNEVCSKGSSGMSMAPPSDPCFTPPPTPAGVEVVIPYPNIAKASDLTKGSSKVKICNKEAALEEDSYISTSKGNEAAKPSSMKGGVISKTTSGKAYFTKWSSDVKFEGKGVCRHVDITTHNHEAKPGNGGMSPQQIALNPKTACEANFENIDKECNKSTEGDAAKGKVLKVTRGACRELNLLKTPKSMEGCLGNESEARAFMERFNDICEKKRKTYTNQVLYAASMSKAVESNSCLRSLRCSLNSYKDAQKKGKDDSQGLNCCPGQTPHHVIPAEFANIECYKYDSGDPAYNKAPCICVEGCTNSEGTHGVIHSNLKRLSEKAAEKGIVASCKDLMKYTAASVAISFPGCDRKCIEAQLKDNQSRDCEGCPQPQNTGKSTFVHKDGKKLCGKRTEKYFAI